MSNISQSIKSLNPSTVNSKNCLNALETAKRLNLKTVLFTQKDKIPMKIADVVVGVPSSDTQTIQECHIVAYHVVAELVEKILFTKEISS